MEKTLITLLIALAFNLSNAQELYKTYEYGKIEITVKAGVGQSAMYLHIDDICIILNKSDRIEFLKFIGDSYSKYVEWSDLAKKNNVTTMSKAIETISFPSFFDYGGWRFSNAKITSMISIINGSPNYFLYISAMQDSKNQYIKSSPKVLILSFSVMSDLATYLNEWNISEFIELKNEENELFK